MNQNEQYSGEVFSILARKKFPRLAGLCGVAVPLVAFSCIFLAISQSPWFSWTANALSDLGVGEAAWVFNGGLMAAGGLTGILAAGLWVAYRRRIVARAGAGLLFLGACSLFGIGLFSEAAGAIHGYFSVAFFVLLPLALFALGVGLIRAGPRGFGFLTVVTGVVAIVPWVFRWDGIAIPEAISALAAGAWSVAQGARLYLGRG